VLAASPWIVLQHVMKKMSCYIRLFMWVLFYAAYDCSRGPTTHDGGRQLIKPGLAGLVVHAEPSALAPLLPFSFALLRHLVISFEVADLWLVPQQVKLLSAGVDTRYKYYLPYHNGHSNIP
jgi:hypothetical protein